MFFGVESASAEGERSIVKNLRPAQVCHTMDTLAEARHRRDLLIRARLSERTTVVLRATTLTSNLDYFSDKTCSQAL